ncbi:MAG: YidC/Oxa1 family membrane protein insertase [Candidatus Dojkabacteria bacterium]|nr:YidC/Oxa1 family membrane protein insertase [Candidatus Dojkabacteria bacterium]
MLTTIWNTVLYYPILNLMVALYHLFGNNLGLAIIAIAIIFRLILIPFTKSQTNMTKKMASMKPQLDALQKKYANNKQKLAEEQMKLYKEVGYNPLGCIVSLIPQLIILTVLIGVLRAVTNNSFEGLYPFVREWAFGSGEAVINTRFIVWDLARQLKGGLAQDQLDKIGDFIKLSPWQIIETYKNGGISQEVMSLFYKFGISNQYGLTSLYSIYYMILAAIVGVSQYFTSVFTQKIQNPNPQKEESKKKKVDGPDMEGMQKKMMGSMNFILPLMTVFIAISAPAALSLYWIVQSVMLIAQYFILDFDKTKKGVQNMFTSLKNKFKKKTKK